MFGFLEFEEDQEVLDALLGAALVVAGARLRADGRADGFPDER